MEMRERKHTIMAINLFQPTENDVITIARGIFNIRSVTSLNSNTEVFLHSIRLTDHNV